MTPLRDDIELALAAGPATAWEIAKVVATRVSYVQRAIRPLIDAGKVRISGFSNTKRKCLVFDLVRERQA